LSLQYHIHLDASHLEGNDGMGRVVFLPGDRSRAARIAAHFDDCTVLENPRGHTAHLGRLDNGQGTPIDVLSISSGMGCASVEIILHELLTCGARRILRVGSSAAMSPALPAGNVVIVTGAVRDEGTSRHYAPPELPAFAHPSAVQALVQGARDCGLASHTHLGLCHTKDSLYAREFGRGPAGEANEAYTAWLRRCGAIVTDMEASTLFIMAQTASAGTVTSLIDSDRLVPVQTGCVLAVFAPSDACDFHDPEIARLAEERAIKVALSSVSHWLEPGSRIP